MNLPINKDFNRPNYFAIPCLYDSHLHLLGLGKYQNKLDLSTIKKATDLNSYISSNYKDFNLLNNSNESFDKSNFIEGFGLQDSLIKDLPSLTHILSSFEYNNPNYYFVTQDGHQLFTQGPLLNDFKTSSAFKTLRDQDYICTNNSCLFYDKGRKAFEVFIKKFKKETSTQEHLMRAQSILIQKGITHCRDLTSDLKQTENLDKLINSENYIIKTETFFSDFYGQSIDSLIKDSLVAKKLLTKNSILKHKGVKIFLDGTFSQNTADCSCLNTKKVILNASPQFSSYSVRELTQILLDIANNNLEVAFHTIGDLAVEKVILAYDQVKDQFNTQLHLEHCEVINTKTRRLLEKLNSKYRKHLHFHMQPNHYFMDQTKLHELKALDPELLFFGWDKLNQLGYKISFGSDAPVTKPGIDYALNDKNMSTLFENLKFNQFWPFYTYPEYQKDPLTYSLFNKNELVAVYISGKKVFIRETFR